MYGHNLVPIMAIPPTHSRAWRPVAGFDIGEPSVYLLWNADSGVKTKNLWDTTRI